MSTDIIEALKSENTSLKQVIENLSDEKMALEQTMVETLRDKINLKAHIVGLEKKLYQTSAELQVRVQDLQKLTEKNSEALPTD